MVGHITHSLTPSENDLVVEALYAYHEALMEVRNLANARRLDASAKEADARGAVVRALAARIAGVRE